LGAKLIFILAFRRVTPQGLAQIMPLHQTFFSLFLNISPLFLTAIQHHHSLKAMTLPCKKNAFILQLHYYYGAKTMLFILLSHSLYNPLLVNQLQEEGKSSLNIWE
jgi:hypothetical protein